MMIHREKRVFEYFQSPKWGEHDMEWVLPIETKLGERLRDGSTLLCSLVKVYGRSLGQNQYVNFKIGGKIEDSGFRRYLEM